MPRERELEENEVKLDNLLHKIMACSREIQALAIEFRHTSPEHERTAKEIDMLAQTIEHLGGLAALIDEQDERITKELEEEIRSSLDDAIKRIIAVRRTTQ